MQDNIKKTTLHDTNNPINQTALPPHHFTINPLFLQNYSFFYKLTFNSIEIKKRIDTLLSRCQKSLEKRSKNFKDNREIENL